MDPILYITETIPDDIKINRNNIGKLYTNTVSGLIKLLSRAKQKIKIITPYISLNNNSKTFDNSVCLQQKNNKVSCCPTNNGLNCNLNKDVCNKENNCYYKTYFSKTELNNRINIKNGLLIEKEFTKALDNGIQVDMIISHNIKGDESAKMQEKYPEMISIQYLDMSSWYGRGKINTTLIIIDDKDFYFGNIGLDWLQLSQTKGIGIIMLNAGNNIINDLNDYYNSIKIFSSSKYSGISIKDGIVNVDKDIKTPIVTLLDKSINYTLKLPIWTKLNATKYLSPISKTISTKHTLKKPIKLKINDQEGYMFISGSPTDALPKNRTSDVENIIYSIKNAEKFVYICLTGLIPSNDKFYGKNKILKEIWWPKIFDAILYAVYQKSCDVKLLVTYWPLSSNKQTIFMQLLNDLGNSCNISSKISTKSGNTCGSIDVRVLKLDNWDKTPYGINNIKKNFNPIYPKNSRLSLSKFLVTDKNFVLCSSNWIWGSFYNDISLSINFTHTNIINKFKDLFITDWNQLSDKNMITEEQMKFITGETRYQNNLIENKNAVKQSQLLNKKKTKKKIENLPSYQNSIEQLNNIKKNKSKNKSNILLTKILIFIVIVIIIIYFKNN